MAVDKLAFMTPEEPGFYTDTSPQNSANKKCSPNLLSGADEHEIQKAA